MRRRDAERRDGERGVREGGRGGEMGGVRGGVRRGGVKDEDRGEVRLCGRGKEEITVEEHGKEHI